MVRILKTRKVNAVYPFHSFEAEVDTGEEIVYVNFTVQDGEILSAEEVLHSDFCWAYTVPVTEADFEMDSTEYVFADEAVERAVLEQMTAIWNLNPVFVHSFDWSIPDQE